MVNEQGNIGQDRSAKEVDQEACLWMKEFEQQIPSIAEYHLTELRVLRPMSNERSESCTLAVFPFHF
jgi:hypothetical protein